MSKLTTIRDRIADKLQQIDELQQSIRKSAEEYICKVIETGMLLDQATQEMKLTSKAEGKRFAGIIQWLNTEFTMSETTAYRYIKIWKTYGPRMIESENGLCLPSPEEDPNFPRTLIEIIKEIEPSQCRNKQNTHSLGGGSPAFIDLIPRAWAAVTKFLEGKPVERLSATERQNMKSMLEPLR